MSDEPSTNSCFGHLADQKERMLQEHLIGRKVTNPAVLAAMARVPRERFLPQQFWAHAYADKALPIGFEQTISQPFMVGYMTQLLDLKPGMSVLEIGTGSGYQTAILAEISGRVCSVERIESLSQKAESLLTELNYCPKMVSCHVGDGTAKTPLEGQFDRILVTAGAPALPALLLGQLVIGGRMVVPVGPRDNQICLCLERLAGRVVETPGLTCRFVKLIGQHAWPDENLSA